MSCDTVDHEPGTRFVVVEIPPEASEEAADEITEKLFECAADLNEAAILRSKRAGGDPWDLFMYRQHNAPPPNVPAAVSADVIEAAAQAACEFTYPPKTNKRWDLVDDYEQDCWREIVRLIAASVSSPVAGAVVVEGGQS